ncbi:MAG: CoA transferase [Caldilineaceae bacterium]
MPQTDRSGPLAGLKVVEITHIMAGPTCGLMLADYGRGCDQGGAAAQGRRHPPHHSAHH